MPRPNIVFICPDQLSFRAMSPYGNSLVRTPAFQRMADEGVVFERCYANSVLCGPSRFAMFTGLPPMGQSNWANPNCPAFPYLKYMGHLLREAGYFTGSIGKLHGMPEDFEFGFEWAKLLDWPRDHYERWVNERLDGRPDAEAIRAASQNTAEGPHTASSDDDWRENYRIPEELSEEAWIVEETANFLNQRPDDKPFLLHLGFKHPHGAWETEPRDEDRYDPDAIPLPPNFNVDLETKPVLRQLLKGAQVSADKSGWEAEHWRREAAKYLTSVTQVDRAIGEVIDLLERHNLADNTVVILTTDHGEFMGSFGREGKQMLYEEAAHIPLIVWGAGVPNGERRRQLAEQLDLIPTMLDLAGVEVPYIYEGRSLVRTWMDEAPTKPFVHAWFEFMGRVQQMTTDGRFKLYRAQGGRRWLTPQVEDSFELYDLEADPYELTNAFDSADGPAIRALKEAFCEYFWDHAGVVGCPARLRDELLGEGAGEAFLRRYE